MRGMPVHTASPGIPRSRRCACSRPFRPAKGAWTSLWILACAGMTVVGVGVMGGVECRVRLGGEKHHRFRKGIR